jgi:hypothetical protein
MVLLAETAFQCYTNSEVATMNKWLNRGTALMIAMGFLTGASFLALPAGAAGPRAPAFDVSVTFTQAGQPVTAYDFNTAGNLTIDMLIGNTGSNTSTASVVLGVEWDSWGSNAEWSWQDLHTWSPQVLNNGTPTPLSFTWETTDDPYLPWINPYEHVNIYVNVTDGAVSLNYSKTLNVSVAAGIVNEITLTTSNAIDPGKLVLGVDTLTVKSNVTIIAIGKDTTGGIINFYLDDMMGDPIGNVSMGNVGTVSNGTVKQYEFVTNLSKVSPAPSFDDHMIYAEAVLGWVRMSNVSADSFAIVAPVPDVILAGFTVDPMSVTIHKGETVPVTMTATIMNNGTGAASNATVHFFDGTTELGVNYTGPIDAKASKDIPFVYELNDTTALGNHTLAAGVDSQTPPVYYTELNITVLGVANVTVSALAVSPVAGAFEGDNVTLTATLFNNGTDDAVNQTVTWYDGTTQIGTTTNITVAKGGTSTATLIYALPSVDSDANRTIKAMVGASFMTINVLDKNKAPKIELTAFTIPSGFKMGDVVTFQATVLNNGTGDAVGMTVSFLDNATSLNTSAAFNLSAGQSKQISLNVTIAGLPDANHTFQVQSSVAGSQSKAITQMVGHKLSAASIAVKGFSAKPAKLTDKAKDSTQTVTLTLTVANSGELQGTVTVSIKEKTKVVATENITLAGLTNTTKTYTWKIKGSGDHTATVTLTGSAGSPATSTAKASLTYASPGFELVALAAAIVAAFVLVGRRKN